MALSNPSIQQTTTRLFQWRSSDVSSCRSLLWTRLSDVYLEVQRSREKTTQNHTVAVLSKPFYVTIHGVTIFIRHTGLARWGCPGHRWVEPCTLPGPSDASHHTTWETLIWRGLPHDYSSPRINTLYTLKRIHKSSFAAAAVFNKGYKWNIWSLKNTSYIEF